MRAPLPHGRPSRPFRAYLVSNCMSRGATPLESRCGSPPLIAEDGEGVYPR